MVFEFDEFLWDLHYYCYYEFIMIIFKKKMVVDTENVCESLFLLVRMEVGKRERCVQRFADVNDGFIPQWKLLSTGLPFYSVHVWGLGISPVFGLKIKTLVFVFLFFLADGVREYSFVVLFIYFLSVNFVWLIGFLAHWLC